MKIKKNWRKKAQMSQAFTYITIILVIGVVAVVGAKAVFGVFKTSCDVKYQEFTLKINQFSDSYSDKGSVRFETLAVPCDATKVIFVDGASVGDLSFAIPDQSVITSSVKDGTYNIFVKREFIEPIGLSTKIAVGDGLNPYLELTPKNGNVKIKFIGEGKKTRIEPG